MKLEASKMKNKPWESLWNWQQTLLTNAALSNTEQNNWTGIQRQSYSWTKIKFLFGFTRSLQGFSWSVHKLGFFWFSRQERSAYLKIFDYWLEKHLWEAGPLSKTGIVFKTSACVSFKFCASLIRQKIYKGEELISLCQVWETSRWILSFRHITCQKRFLRSVPVDSYLGKISVRYLHKEFF